MSELRTVVLIWTLLLAMFVAAAIGSRHRSGTVVLALTSLVWLLVDNAFEGVVLVDLTPSNGLTTSDLVGVVGILVAGGQWVRLRRQRR